MTSTVLVKMNTCSKTHRITVSLRDDGDLDLSIVSDCKNVQAYAEKIQKISMDDITEFCNSRLNSPENKEIKLITQQIITNWDTTAKGYAAKIVSLFESGYPAWTIKTNEVYGA